MGKNVIAAAAAFLSATSAWAHDSAVPHAHPHGIDTVAAFLAAGGLLGLLWYLGLPPFESRAAQQIERQNRDR
jgi:hypothetical protein